MAINGSDQGAPCPDFDWYFNAGKITSAMVYWIITPCYILLALFLHGLSLAAFYKQAKQDKGYLFQISVTVSEALEVVASLVYAGGFAWFTDVLLNARTTWFNSCHTCMLITARICTLFINSMLTISLLLSVCMSADRLYALWKPFSYKAANIKRNHTVAVIVCTFLGILTSCFHVCLFQVLPRSNDPNSTAYQQYQIVYSPTCVEFVNVMGEVRDVMQGVALALLYIFSIALVWLFRVQNLKATKMMANVRGQGKTRRKNEKTLALLTICQCVCMTLSRTYDCVNSTIVIFSPTFVACWGLVFIPFHDVVMHVIDVAEFVFAVTVSKHFRTMIQQQIPCRKENTIVSGSHQAGVQT